MAFAAGMGSISGTDSGNRDIGADVLRVLIGFNSGHYQAIDLSEWLAGNPVDVLATNLDPAAGRR